MANPRLCSVCAHPDLVSVDAALRAGTPPLRTIADQYKVSKTALLRHREAHLIGPRRTGADLVRDQAAAIAPIQLARASSELVKVQAARLVDDALDARDLARALAKRAAEDPDMPVVDAARVVKNWVDANGGGAVKALHLLGMSTGEIRTGSQTLVLVQDGRVVHPELAEVMAVVTEALVPFPEAGAAVQRALEEMGQGGARTT